MILSEIVLLEKCEGNDVTMRISMFMREGEIQYERERERREGEKEKSERGLVGEKERREEKWSIILFPFFLCMGVDEYF